MYIQYIGFYVAASSRIYNFDVIDKAEGAREFTVKVQSEAFRSAHLKFQEGPGICFERLEQELERETPGARAEAHLSVREQDIHEYLQGHFPRKPLAKNIASYGSLSKPLDDLDREAILEAIHLDQQDTSQRKSNHQKKQPKEIRATRDKAALVNNVAFRTNAQTS